MADAFRLNLTLDEPHAAKLRALAEKTHLQEGTLARSLLSSALDHADLTAPTVVDVLNGIPGALERARLGSEDAHEGRTTDLADF